MKFEWDENKRLANLQRHGFDFADAWRVFDSHRVIFIDDRFDYGESRIVTIGFFSEIVYTEDDEIIRIISLRKATKNERTKYNKGIANRLGEN